MNTYKRFFDAALLHASKISLKISSYITSANSCVGLLDSLSCSFYQIFALNIGEGGKAKSAEVTKNCLGRNVEGLCYSSLGLA